MSVALKMIQDENTLPFTPEALKAANINPVSHLATDYLNHFNEVLMILELLPQMPDMVGDVLTWKPKDYVSHFQDSTFAGKELAIAAYHAAPSSVKKPFEQTIGEIDTFILEAQRKIQDISLEDELRVSLLVEDTLETVRPLLGEADRIIHSKSIEFEGDEVTDMQDDIDNLFNQKIATPLKNAVAKKVDEKLLEMFAQNRRASSKLKRHRHFLRSRAIV